MPTKKPETEVTPTAEPRGLVEVESSVTLALDDGEDGPGVALAPGVPVWVDPEHPGIAPLMDIYLHPVRHAD